VDWHPEETDEIEATLQAARIIRKLVGEGHEVDCIDAWIGGDKSREQPNTLEVDLAEIEDAEFRFFENHYFSFTIATR